MTKFKIQPHRQHLIHVPIVLLLFIHTSFFSSSTDWYGFRWKCGNDILSNCTQAHEKRAVIPTVVYASEISILNAAGEKKALVYVLRGVKDSGRGINKWINSALKVLFQSLNTPRFIHAHTQNYFLDQFRSEVETESSTFYGTTNWNDKRSPVFSFIVWNTLCSHLMLSFGGIDDAENAT